MLHPEIAAFLDLADAGQAVVKFHQLQPQQARLEFQRATERMRWPAPTGLSVDDFQARTRDRAALPLRLYRPHLAGPGPLPVLVYFHGGGFVVGSLESHDGVCRELCARSGLAVLAVGYRLAPEHRFPVALQDAEDALTWLSDRGPQLGLSTGQVAFGGDSAGATLAAVLAVAAARDGEHLAIVPKAQLLCYPVTDASRETVSHTLFDQGYLLESETLEWFYNHYARAPEDRSHWRFSPLLAEDLSGVAPALMVLAGLDPLLDEGMAYGRRLMAASVPVTLVEMPDMPHDLLRLGALTGDVFEVYERIGHTLAQWLGNGSQHGE